MADAPAALRQSIDAATAAAVTSAGVLRHAPDVRPARSAPLDIVIPVFNNASLLERCLRALLPTLSSGDEVWLFDDASDDADVATLLTDFGRRWSATRAIRNARNLGFVGTSNRAFSLTRRDLVLLNSDTEPAAGWLEHLQDCMERNPRAGIVCPLSDRATILSALPAGGRADPEAIAAAAAALAPGDVPLPTAVGFCMLIRRRLLDDIGGFSPVFAPGYGEENDFSMRALKAGWDILAAERACVFHHSGGSFPPERSRSLRIRHQARLDRIWPEYAPLVQSWWRDNPLRARTEHLARQGDRRPGIVHVLHRQYHVGGTERVVRTLIRGLGPAYRQTLLYPGQTDNPWCDAELRGTGPGSCRELMLNNRWIRPTTRIGGHGADLTCAHSERALARIVHGSGARIVHLHHMLHWDSLLLPAISRALGCRVVISVHDFWFNCPIHNQLEHRTGEPCGRRHAAADRRCGECLTAYGLRAEAVPTYTRARHGAVLRALEQADAVILPSEFLRARLLAAYPLASHRHLRVESHGVAIPTAPPARRQAPGRVLAYFGGDQVLKGSALVLQLARMLTGAGVVVRIHGRIKAFDRAGLPENVELHGFYNPDDVSRVMAGVDLALLPSFYEESFSLIASECWAHGVPVLSSERGALRDRIEPGRNGWVVPDMSAESWMRALREVLAGDTLERCRARLANYPVTSIDESVRRLDALYRELLESPPPDAEGLPAPSAPSPQRFRRKLENLRAEAGPRPERSGHRCLGVLRDHWGTAKYRVRFPLEDLARSGSVAESAFHVLREAGFDLGPALQRCAAPHVVVQPFLSDEGLRLMEYLHRETGIDVTLVIDDLWTGLREDNPARALMPDDVAGRLDYAASLSRTVVLTTDELARQLALRHDRLHVIDNALPGWIWNGLRVPEPVPDARLRVGWAGAPQHAADLAFLKPVIRDTADLADWVFLGLCPDELRPLACEVLPMVPFDRYPATLAGLGLDIAIAPLADHPFNRCKSHLKVLECGILGVPVIAADLPPYRHCPVPLAAPDDARDWTARLRLLLADAEARRAHGSELRRWVLANHLTEHRRPDWAVALGIRSDAD